MDDPRKIASWRLREPIWAGDTVHRESVVLLQERDGAPLVGRLAFPPTAVVEVRSAAGDRTYGPADGLKVDAAAATIAFPAASSLPKLRAADMYLPPKSPHAHPHRAGNPNEWLLYRTGRWFHDRNLEVTYRRAAGAWQGPKPAYAGALLPRTAARLKAGQPLTIGMTGDSIAVGADASGLANAPPRQPGFVEMFAAQLGADAKSKIALRNRAVGGWSVANAFGDLDKLLAEKPHLVLVAYGMNDVGRRDPEWFAERNRELLRRLRAADPAIEVVLVSTMVGNSEWVHTPRAMFAAYRDQLATLVGPGVAHADVTSLWLELLRRKHDFDLTGNGLNHPNDFGHRLYAQALSALLLEPRPA